MEVEGRHKHPGLGHEAAVHALCAGCLRDDLGCALFRVELGGNHTASHNGATLSVDDVGGTAPTTA